MLRRSLTLLTTASMCFAAGPSKSGRPLPTSDSRRFASQLLPALVAIIDRIASGSVVEHHRPEYLAVATGKDEYIYHLNDRVFIRCIKDRYEMPTSRICGDVAVVRVELMDDSMKTVPPIMAWYMIYRDGEWRKLMRDEGGEFLWDSYKRVELPPYATRCFNLPSTGGKL